MGSTSRAAQHYLQTQVQSRTPLELVVMLYDGALASAATAHDAMVRRDIPTRRTALSRTMAIVSELQATLDMERGGAVAAELDRLYTWMTSRLVDATVQQDAAPIRDVHRILTILRDAWREIAVAKPAPESAA
jgi:flagellar secretion chaperone FliS